MFFEKKAQLAENPLVVPFGAPLIFIICLYKDYL